MLKETGVEATCTSPVATWNTRCNQEQRAQQPMHSRSQNQNLSKLIDKIFATFFCNIYFRASRTRLLSPLFHLSVARRPKEALAAKMMERKDIHRCESLQLHLPSLLTPSPSAPLLSTWKIWCTEPGNLRRKKTSALTGLKLPSCRSDLYPSNRGRLRSPKIEHAPLKADAALQAVHSGVSKI